MELYIATTPDPVHTAVDSDVAISNELAIVAEPLSSVINAFQDNRIAKTISDEVTSESIEEVTDPVRTKSDWECVVYVRGWEGRWVGEKALLTITGHTL